MSTQPVHTEEREGFTIRLYFEDELDSPDWDMTDAERTQLIDDIENGKYLWFCAKVTASKAGVELGTGYLGCCCYESVADFMAPDGYYLDMVEAAISEAKAKLVELCK